MESIVILNCSFLAFFEILDIWQRQHFPFCHRSIWAPPLGEGPWPIPAPSALPHQWHHQLSANQCCWVGTQPDRARCTWEWVERGEDWCFCQLRRSLFIFNNLWPMSPQVNRSLRAPLAASQLIFMPGGTATAAVATVAQQQQQQQQQEVHPNSNAQSDNDQVVTTSCCEKQFFFSQHLSAIKILHR